MKTYLLGAHESMISGQLIYIRITILHFIIILLIGFKQSDMILKNSYTAKVNVALTQGKQRNKALDISNLKTGEDDSFSKTAPPSSKVL